MEGAVPTSSAWLISQPPPFFPSKPSPFLTEHLHWPSFAFPSHQVLQSRLLKSRSVQDGSRKYRSNASNYAVVGRSSQEDEKRMSRGSSSGRWSNQKRLLALFKQIETSISLEKAGSGEGSGPLSSKADILSIESVLEALEQSGRGEKKSDHTSKTSVTDKEPNLLDHQSSAYKTTRPPSTFMKKSPIPSPTPSVSSVELNAVVVSSDGGVEDEDLLELGKGVEDEDLLELEKMNLTELKEIAKSRGIKRYSKMKKSELVGLLSSQAKS